MTVPAQTQPYSLSPEQKQAYHDQGFILIEDFYSPEEHASLVQYTQDLQNWGEAKGKWMQYYEKNTVTGDKQLCRTENFTPFHESLREYVRSQRLMDILKELHGEDYVLFKEKVNYKLPGGGGKFQGFLYMVLDELCKWSESDMSKTGFPPHQDAPAFVQFGQSSHMTVMFTIDPTTAENGCLEVVPGSHKNSYDRRILPQEKHDGSIAREWCNEQNWIPVFCKPVSITLGVD
jgi:ectoine hydroxylase-related dioxygenase (phytanoyl-CoA dioxygenase family)